MAFFNRRKKTQDEEVVVSAEGTTQDKKNKRKKDSLANFLNASVPGTAVDKLKQLEMFGIEHQGVDGYVGFLLDVEDIGGITKKDRKNHDKGQFLSMLTGDTISYYAPDALLEDGKLVLIPDDESLDNLESFTMLLEPDYEIVFINQEGDITGLGKKVKLTDVRKISDGDADISDYLTYLQEDEEEEIESLDEGFDDDIEDDIIEDDVEGDIVEEEEESAPVFEDGDILDEIFDENDDVLDSGAYGTGSGDYDPGLDYRDDEAPFESGGEIYEPTDDEYDEYEEEQSAQESYEEYDEEEHDYPETQDELNDTLYREFFSDHLGLVVDTKPFDIKFLTGNNPVYFDESRPQGWLNDQLNELSRELNAEMQSVHEHNLLRMRNNYLSLVTKHTEDIVTSLDIADPSSDYHIMYNEVLARKGDREEEHDSLVESRKREIREEWDKKLYEVGEAARSSAIERHKNLYGREVEDKLFYVDATVQSERQAKDQDELKALHDMRRREASKLMDLAIVEALNTVGNAYLRDLQDEKVLFQRNKNKILRFLDENRKEDIAYTKALEEEHRRTDKVQQVIQEQENRVKDIVTNHDDEKRRLLNEIDEIKRRHKTDMEELENRHKRREETLREDNERMKDQLSEIIKSYKDLEDKKEKEYEYKTARLISERDDWKDRVDHTQALYDKASKTNVWLMIAIIIAALSAGVVIGLAINSIGWANTLNQMNGL